jgi:hypothetical protein
MDDFEPIAVIDPSLAIGRLGDDFEVSFDGHLSMIDAKVAEQCFKRKRSRQNASLAIDGHQHGNSIYGQRDEPVPGNQYEPPALPFQRPTPLRRARPML